MTYDSPQERIREHLKANPKGLTIEEVSRQLVLNRTTVAKYLNSLVQSGQADLRELGRAKLFSYNKRVPLANIINRLSDLILIIDKDMFVIDANTSLLTWFGILKEDLVKKRLDQTPLNSCLTKTFYSIFSRTLEGSESTHEISLEKGVVVRYFRTCFIPLVLEDCKPGVVILFEDITEIKQNQFDLEARVRERTEALAAANAKLIKKIREHERTLAALKESEAKYRRIVETANEGIWICDPSFTILDCNQRFAEIFGYSHIRDLIKMNLKDFVFPEDLLDYSARMANHANGIKETYEQRFFRKDGSERWGIVSVVPLMDPEGTYCGSFAMLTDITSQKHLEKELVKKSRYYEQLLQTSTDAIHVLDKAGNLIEWNPAFLSLLGYTEDEAAFLNVRDWDACNASSSAYKQIFESHDGEDIRFEMRYRTKNDSILDVEISGTRVSINGEEMFYASTRDITGRKTIERACTARADWVRSVAETVGGLLWETDENGLYRHFSPSIENILGYSREDVIGKMYYYDLVPPSDREKLRSAAEKVFAARKPFRSFKNRIVHKNGHILPVETNAVPIFDADRTFLGYRGIDLVVGEEERAPDSPPKAVQKMVSPKKSTRVKKKD